jgi:hypothetical protein
MLSILAVATAIGSSNLIFWTSVGALREKSGRRITLEQDHVLLVLVLPADDAQRHIKVHLDVYTHESTEEMQHKDEHGDVLGHGAPIGVDVRNEKAAQHWRLGDRWSQKTSLYDLGY